MGHLATGSVARQLGTLFEGGSAAGLSDRQLLERFNARRDAAGEAAFAALVARHGPMVLGVCHRLLDDRHLAEDAFQAVFLVLARRAHSLRDPDLLGHWLYGVALRTARCARSRLARLRRTEELATSPRSAPAGPTAPPADEAVAAREQAEALHAEIERLPAAFRLPVVLCYLEGLTVHEAARRLRCSHGTVRSRMARAREKLRRALTRRGVVLSAAAMAAALDARSAPASVPPALAEMTARAAIGFAARPTAALAREVLRSMLIHKLRTGALTILFVGALAAGAGSYALGAFAGPREGPPAGEPRAQTARTEPRAPDSSRPAPGRMTVVGRVLDPGGKPVPRAAVMVYGGSREAGDRLDVGAPGPLGQGTCDDSGRFRLDLPRIGSATHYGVGVAALAPGFGVGWAGLAVDGDEPAAEITLRPEQVIAGRLFDIKGRVAPGVRVAVEGMGHPRRTPEALPVEIEGPSFWGGGYAKVPPAWPRPAVTDAEGRFTIRGIGRDLRVLLMAEAPEYARERIVVDTGGEAAKASLTVAMQPAKVFTGRVTYSDTGRPVPHAAVEVISYRGGPGYSNHFEADDQGVYRANPLSGDRYHIAAYVPMGEPYLNASTGDVFITWPAGAVEHRVDLALRRGTVIRGRVVEEGTGRPVPGAALRYMGRKRPADAADRGSWNGTARTGPDGSYQVAVRPEAGTLIVLGPSEDYVLREMSRETITEGRPDGMRWYAHAFIPCEPKPGPDSLEVNVAIRRGATVQARVVGPDGRPIREAQVLSRAILQPGPTPWKLFWGDYHGDVRDGRFAMHGLAPDAEIPAYFFDPKDQLGATARFSVAAARDGPIAVRLEPCGLAMGRLVNSKGNPLAGYRNPYLIVMVVTPGPDRLSRVEADKARLAADQDYVSRIDPTHYADRFADARGRITFPALIPGATYRIIDGTNIDAAGRQVRKEFIAAAGEAVELGDIVIEKPRP